MTFVHLHVHSEYSLLDGFSNIKKLVKHAQEMNMPALALTDHGTMFGVIDFYNAATAAGIKPIVGVESYLAARGMRERDPQADKKSTHLLLLAENDAGYKNLLQIASLAQLDGFYYYPRIDHEFLAAHAEGLICTSGCMSAEVPRLIQQGEMEKAQRQLDWYYEVFGPDRFFLELQEHDIKELANINKMLIDLGRRYDARFVATNDVHYIKKEDARLQDILLAIQTGCVLSDPNRMRMTDNSYYLRSPQEMSALFSEIPEAIDNTLLIADRCNIDLSFKGYHLPHFDVPPGYTPETYLRGLCETGLERRYGARASDPVVRERLNYELGIIHQMGFDTYFLIVWDLCRHAREQGIWYNARGSAAGSMVAYTLDITLVDPIQHGLIFERFLNPGRISMPDIDLDFRDDRRAEMIEYTANKYGDDKVAQIITFGTLGARAAIRDVGRVMDIPLPEVDRVSKMIPNIPGKPVSIQQALEEVTELKDLYKSTPYLRELIDTASHMEGVVRNAGTHAAGVIITDKPIIEYIPLHRPTGSAADSPVKNVTQFEMSILESLGLLKVDFLGLDTLSIMARACDLIKQRHGVEFNLDNIPVDDAATFELLGRGDTAGVFQVEGSGMRRWLMQMKPRELANVIAMVALFRPGPMDFIPGYIRRMHGEEPVEYRHPLLEPIFRETYGFPVYQEQLMFAAMQLAGYTAPESDDLRKAISKKQKEKLFKHREKFVKGATQNGIPAETAEAIFTDWEEFARYGFNKCLPGDVEVVDAASGRLVRVEDLYRDPTLLKETLTCDLPTLKFRSGPVSAVMFNGVKPVYRLTTALGRRIEATANHPLYTYEGWRNLEALKVGDFIAVPRCLPVEGSSEWPEYEVIALGHLLDKGTAREKAFPAAVFELTNRQIGLLLSCMWEGGGHIDVHGRSLYYATASERLARQMQHLLLRLGIISRLRTEEFPYQEGRTGYQLFVTHHENIAAFSQKIGIHFVSKERKDALQIICQNQQGDESDHMTPGYRIRLDPQGDESDHMSPGYRIRQGPPGDESPGYQTAPHEWGLPAVIRMQSEEMSRIHPAQLSSPAMNRRAETDYCGSDDSDNDVYWDRVTSIEYVGKKPTYDLEVPGTHNFIAGDILVHNSHAADYGVISVQTAYLKAHYPVEYMTAVLSAKKHETDRVALYVVDCRRMGIPVEPPDVNNSAWDFSIEDRGEGATAIRFGLGAIKNVGQGPVEAILKGRQDGPFKDLNDFARRVDLRQVGKRALESLVKVGVLDSFGPRLALLEAIDRIVSASVSHFRAAEVGQMSLFGAHTGVTEEIILPKTTAEINRREILNWERELIGLYVSDHPLSPVMDVLTEAVTHFSGQLGEANPDEHVRVAGVITRIQHYQSKAGKPMGFVSIEDIQGKIELVIFPRTWTQTAEILDYDKIILVDGKVDRSGAEPKVLVDRITTEFKLTTSAEKPVRPVQTQYPQDLPTERTLDDGRRTIDLPPRDASQPEEDDWGGEGPPPPDPFPPDWESAGWDSPEPVLSTGMKPPGQGQAGQGGSTPASVVEAPRLGDALAAAAMVAEAISLPPTEQEGEGQGPGWSPDDLAAPGQDSSASESFAEISAGLSGDARSEEAANASAAAAEPPAQEGSTAPLPVAAGTPAPTLEAPGVTPPYLIPPAAVSEGEAIHMITVALRPTEDKTRDVLRIRRLHGTLMSYPGSDRFAFQVFERGHGYLVEFPNFTTGLCPELLSRLQLMVGSENVRVERILLQ